MQPYCNNFQLHKQIQSLDHVMLAYVDCKVCDFKFHN